VKEMPSARIPELAKYLPESFQKIVVKMES